MNIKVTYFLIVAALLSSGCKKIYDSTLKINTSWDMLTVEPTPKKFVAVIRDSVGDMVKSHEFYSPEDVDTIQDGSYSIYSYYVKENVFTINNLENYRETQFVVKPNSDGTIPTQSELYVSSLYNFDTHFYLPTKVISQTMRPEFTAADLEVVFVDGSNVAGLNACDVTIGNVYDTYDIYTRSVAKGALKSAKTSLTQTGGAKFFGIAYYLGFDPNNSNALTVDLRCANGNRATAMTDLANRLSSYKQKIVVTIYLYCDTSQVTNGRFLLEIRNVSIRDAETIYVEG